MTAPRFSKLAAKLLAARAIADAPSLTHAQQERGVATVAAALEARQARRQRVRTYPMLAAAAVLLLGTLGAVAWAADLPRTVAFVAARGTMYSDTSDVTLTRDGKAMWFEGQTQIRLHDEIQVDPSDGPGHLSLTTGTRLRLAVSSVLKVARLGLVQEFLLTAGKVDADVAKLSRHTRFVVSTRDTQVEVRGTRFSVEVETENETCEVNTQTRVRVDEGAVVVRHANRSYVLRAGQRWPTRCAAPRASAQQPGASVVRSPADRMSERTRSPADHAADHASESSSLAEQNDIFARALLLRRQDKPVEAIEQLDMLLRRFPDGPMTESANIEKLRLLRATRAPEDVARYARYLRHRPRRPGPALAREIEQTLGPQ